MNHRWSTADAPRAEQFTRWRELICEAFLDLTPESDLRGGFSGTVVQRPLGALSIARIDSQRQRVRRTSRDIDRRPQRGYYANFQLAGSSLMTQHGRSTVLRPGDLALVDTAEPFAFDFRDDFRQLSFYIPKELLDEQMGSGVRTATRIQTAAGPGAAVRHALTSLTRDDFAPATAERLAAHTCGMLAVALEHFEISKIKDAATSSRRHERLHAAALEDIAEHLTDDGLSAAVTARRLGISVRLLYAVFAGHEHSYAGEVRRRRLELAWRDLQDPALAHLRVIDVAIAAGFLDVAGFHRAFRRAYGRTPGEVRSRLGLGQAG
jgi:AraC family transcriptional activator of tynA and feaB